MLSFFFINAYSTIHSTAGTDKVAAQETDSVIIIGNVSKPEKVKHIREANFTRPIGDDEYMWPGHGKSYDLDITDLEKERDLIQKHFCTNSQTITQDDLYYHPAGTRQFYENDDSRIANAQRYKIRIFINTRYNKYHWTGFYAPPGELITIEIPQKAVGKIQYRINSHVRTRTNYQLNRLDQVHCFPPNLNSTIVKFGWPFGGSLELYTDTDSFPEGVEANITGVIKMPYFRYGVTSDEEWNNEIRHNPAPLTVVDSGSIHFVGPSAMVRHVLNPSKGMAIWRTVSQVYYSLQNATSSFRRQDNRILDPVHMYFDDYVPQSAYAVAEIYLNYAILPSHDFHFVMDGTANQWGCHAIIHEYGHMFQSKWFFNDDEEVTNRHLNYLNYNMWAYNEGSRQPAADNTVTTMHDVNDVDFTCYQSLEDNPVRIITYKRFWNVLYYSFGPDKHKEAINAYASEKYYKKGQMGIGGVLLLTMSKVHGYDFRKYFKSFKNPFNIFDFEDSFHFNPSVFQELDKMNLPEFHPVANIYQTGYVRNGVELDFIEPFHIFGKDNYTFDFNVIRTRPSCHSFKFDSIETKSLEGTMTEISSGKYKYTPPNSDPIEKIYVKYRDLETNTITTTIVSFKQVYNGTRLYFKVPSNQYIKNYQYYNEFIPFKPDEYTQMMSNQPMNIPPFSIQTNFSRGLICLAEGAYIAPRTAKYRFYATSNRNFLIYFSNESFSSDGPEPLDKLVTNHTRYACTDKYAFTFDLKQGVKYYYRIIVYEASGVPSFSCRVIIDNDATFSELEDNYSRFANCDLSDVSQNPMSLQLLEDPTIGLYHDYKTIRYTSALYNTSNNIKFEYINADGVDRKITSSFPINYIFESKNNIRVNKMYLQAANNIPMDSNIKIKCDGKIVYSGNYKSDQPNITFDSTHDGNNFEIIIESNTYGTYSSLEVVIPMFQISSTKNIIPATHTKIIKEGDAKLTDKGLYYNGKGMNLKTGSSMKFTIQLNSSGDSIGFIGDKCTYGGSFDVYIDGKFDRRVRTNSFLANEDLLMAGDKFYQAPLTGIRNLAPSSKHTVKIQNVKGEVTLAGFLSNGNIIDYEDVDITTHPPSYLDNEVLFTEHSNNEHIVIPPSTDDDDNNEKGKDDEKDNENDKDDEKDNENDKDDDDDNNEKDNGKDKDDEDNENNAPSASASISSTHDKSPQNNVNEGNSKKKMLAISLSISTFIIIAVVAVIAIVLMRIRSSRIAAYENELKDPDTDDIDL